MKMKRPSLVKFALLSAAGGFALLPSCKSEESDGGDGDTVSATGGGGAGVGVGGAPVALAGAGGEDPGSGGAGTGGVGVDLLALPDLLSETGLYESDMETLAPGVRPFRPQFPLWTDGAKKRRWVFLPEGETIDTSDMDYWELPIGTKLWKEFSRDGVRVETRLLERRDRGIWVMVAYQWRDDLSDADKVQAGVENASGTDHDIPSEEQCWQCHNQVPGRAIGFSAIQLAHDAGMGVGGASAANEWTLDDLHADGWLTDAPPVIDVPGVATQRDALGYLHANCGHCHHPQSSVSARVNMQLWLTVGDLEEVETTQSYMTTVGVNSTLSGEGPAGADLRIAPQVPAGSSVYARFSTVGEDYSMPPLGTEIVDPTGEQVLRDWIESLPPPPP